MEKGVIMLFIIFIISAASAIDSNSIEESNKLTTEENTNCIEDWTCEPWLECRDGIQKRKCREQNYCETKINKPATEKPCENDITTKNTLSKESTLDSSKTSEKTTTQSKGIEENAKIVKTETIYKEEKKSLKEIYKEMRISRKIQTLLGISVVTLGIIIILRIKWEEKNLKKQP